MEFQEAEHSWTTTPQWAMFLLRAGYFFQMSAKTQARRIAVISLPCDCAAAGLLALGALRRRLEDEDGSDLAEHFGRLRDMVTEEANLDSHRRTSLRRQGDTSRYVVQGYEPEMVEVLCADRTGGGEKRITRETVSRWSLENSTLAVAVSPEERFGHISSAARRPNPTLTLRNVDDGRLYRVSRHYSERISVETRAGRYRSRTILQREAALWTIEDEGTVFQSNEGAVPFEKLYNALPADGPPLDPSNLQSTDSTICLAGRVLGAEATMSTMRKIRIRGCGADPVDLGSLLTIRGDSWPETRVSRVSFFNPRTNNVDRCMRRIQTIFADGINSTLKVATSGLFDDCNIVGAVHRAVTRDELESLGSWIMGLGQWYERDMQFLNGLGTPPRGILVEAYRRLRL